MSFSRTFKDFTSILFDGFLLIKYEEFYQDIYNNNISQDNHTEVFTQVMSFPQRPDFGHQPLRDRDKLYSISMRQVIGSHSMLLCQIATQVMLHNPEFLSKRQILSMGETCLIELFRRINLYI